MNPLIASALISTAPALFSGFMGGGSAGVPGVGLPSSPDIQSPQGGAEQNTNLINPYAMRPSSGGASPFGPGSGAMRPLRLPRTEQGGK